MADTTDERLAAGERVLERLDAYVLRRWGWTDPEVVQVRSTVAHGRWFAVVPGDGWPHLLGWLEPGERPELVDGVCHVVRS